MDSLACYCPPGYRYGQVLLGFSIFKTFNCKDSRYKREADILQVAESPKKSSVRNLRFGRRMYWSLFNAIF